MEAIIGGRTRVIDRVQSLADSKDTKGMTVQEILDESRALKMVNKFVEKKAIQIGVDIATGSVRYAAIPIYDKKIPKTSSNPVRRAKKIEMDAAMFSAGLF